MSKRHIEMLHRYHKQHGAYNVNVNHVHEEYKRSLGFNGRVAVLLTRGVGTMWTAYSFVVLALVGLLAILGWLNPIVALLVAWLSQTLIQLVLLPVIMVGQNLQGKHSELRAEADHVINGENRQRLKEIAEHQDTQDEKISELSQRTEQMHKMLTRLDRVARGEA